jgi:hypothetical protein
MQMGIADPFHIWAKLETVAREALPDATPCCRVRVQARDGRSIDLRHVHAVVSSGDDVLVDKSHGQFPAPWLIRRAG